MHPLDRRNVTIRPPRHEIEYEATYPIGIEQHQPERNSSKVLSRRKYLLQIARKRNSWRPATHPFGWYFGAELSIGRRKGLLDWLSQGRLWSDRGRSAPWRSWFAKWVLTKRARGAEEPTHPGLAHETVAEIAEVLEAQAEHDPVMRAKLLGIGTGWFDGRSDQLSLRPVDADPDHR